MIDEHELIRLGGFDEYYGWGKNIFWVAW